MDKINQGLLDKVFVGICDVQKLIPETLTPLDPGVVQLADAWHKLEDAKIFISKAKVEMNEESLKQELLDTN